MVRVSAAKIIGIVATAAWLLATAITGSIVWLAAALAGATAAPGCGQPSLAVISRSVLAAFFITAAAGAVSDGLQGAVEFAAALTLVTLIPIGIVYTMAHDRLSPEGGIRRNREVSGR